MKKSRLVVTLIVLGTGAVMAASFLAPGDVKPPAPAGMAKAGAPSTVTEIAPVERMPSPGATAPANTTVIAPQTPLFRSATTAAPIVTSAPDSGPAYVRHHTPAIEASSEPLPRSAHSPEMPDAATAATPSMAPPPAAATGLAAAEPGLSDLESSNKLAPTAKSSRKPKPTSTPASPKPAGKRADSLFLHPLGTR